MRVSRFILHLSALAIAALALGACATQPRDEVRVGVGTEWRQPAKARDYAALYTPYAMMASIAYTNAAALNGYHCPDIAKLGIAQPGETPADANSRKTLRGWIAALNARGWACRFGVYGSLPCPPRAGDCHPVSGLEFHVWRRTRGAACREVVIAFRGTDKNDTGDWISNLRWLDRLVPRFDQYAQVQTHITQIVQRIKHSGCGGAGTQFVTAGHSLGGGLAQQAAYADAGNDIRYVYAFDPSPVTGLFDVSDLVREHSTKGLGIDRAFEQGEILALPRRIVEIFIPPSDCHPRIRTVRFSLLPGSPIEQHSIAELTAALRMAGRERGANPARVYDGLRARNCSGEPIVLPPA